MKAAFIVVTAGESNALVDSVKKQIRSLGFRNYRFYHIKNKRGEEGFAQGFNRGIKRGLKDKIDIFINISPDVSLLKLTAEKILSPRKTFDIWGFAFEQKGKAYYGGEIDKWRLSGGLISRKPKLRLITRDFVSGSLMCIKKEVIGTVGLWDEKYFLYYEEVDYCLRARQAGFKVGIDSKSLYEHFEFSEEDNPLKKYYLSRSRLRFLLKHGTILQKLYEIIRLPKTLLENRQSFSFNFLSLNVSSLLNKALAFILFLFLVRFLSPKDYGIYTLVWVQLGLLAPLSDFGTTSFGILQSEFGEKKAFNDLFSMRLILSIVVVILTLSLVYAFRFDSRFIFFVLLGSPLIFSNALSGSLLILSSLKNKVYLTSIISVGFNLILTVLLIIALYFSRSLNLIFQTVFVCYLLYALINIIVLNRENQGISFKLKITKWLRIAKKSAVFVLIGFFAGLYFRIDVFLLNYLKGQQAIGVYSAGYKFLEALLFFPASYNIVSIPLLTKIFSNNKRLFFERIEKDFMFVGVASLLFTLIISSISPYILPFFLKGEFSDSISVFQIVIFAFPLLFVTSIMLNGLYILRKAYVVIYLFVIQLILNVGLNLLFIPKYSYIGSSYITVVSEIVNLILAVLLFKYFFNQCRTQRL